jgi:SP family general alpha glucoside:H+ symporter-like MFS transporter
MYKSIYIVSAQWQIAFNSTASVGGFFGCLGAGYLADKIGKRGTMAMACVVSIVGVLLQILARASVMLLVGKLINGLALGIYLTVSSSYAAEICPVEVRGLTTSGVQLFISLGQLLANLIVKTFGTGSTSRSYKIPIAIQFAFPLFLLCGLPFCPESPWYLLRTDQRSKALKTLERLGYPHPLVEMAEIIKTMELEETESANTSYLDCFRGVDLRRTEIAMGVFAVSQLVGAVFVFGYSSYFFELAGISTSNAFSMSLGTSGIGLVSIVMSWFLINSKGRRSSFLIGTVGLMIVLFLMGILDVVPHAAIASGPIYGQVACIFLFACIYFLTVGPMAWTIFAEVASSRLRSRTVGLGIVVQSLFGVLLNIVVPLMIK